jgi:hypothetical protein
VFVLSEADSARIVRDLAGFLEKGEKPAAEKPAGDKPADKPLADKPAGDKKP